MDFGSDAVLNPKLPDSFVTNSKFLKVMGTDILKVSCTKNHDAFDENSLFKLKWIKNLKKTNWIMNENLKRLENHIHKNRNNVKNIKNVSSWNEIQLLVYSICMNFTKDFDKKL